MGLLQILKRPLRILGLEAEPKDSPPLPLSEDMQRALSLICGVNRQSLIPFVANPGGSLSVCPPSIIGENVIDGDTINGNFVTFDPPVDMLEAITINSVGFVKYGDKTPVHIAVPFSVSFALDSTNLLKAGFMSWRIMGPIRQWVYTSLLSVAVPEILYTGIRFKHGRE